MTRATMILIVCLVASAWPEGAQAQSAWRVAARLLVRTGGDHLEQQSIPAELGGARSNRAPLEQIA